MINVLISCAAMLAALAAAVPHSLARRTENIDITILQFALTLEHLENVFYKEALLRFSEDDFKKAGFGKKFFEKLLFVVEDEQSHVQLLTTAIAASNTIPVAACTYNFPYTDVASFVTLSSVLEGVGTSAYLGAAALVTDKTILTTAASILVTEALHTSQQRDAVNLIPAANALGTPLGANAVFTLAASFIVSCPSSNAPLPFTPFPSLAVDISSCSSTPSDPKKSYQSNYDDGKGNKKDDYNKDDPKKDDYKKDDYNKDDYNKDDPKKDDYNKDDPKKDDYKKDDYKEDDYKSNDYKPSNYNDDYNNYYTSSICPEPSVLEVIAFIGSSAIPAGSFLTFVSGLTVISIQATIVEVSISGQVPVGLGGQTYVFVTNKEVKGTLMDADILMGPAIIEVNPTPPVIDNNVVKRGGEVLSIVN